MNDKRLMKLTPAAPLLHFVLFVFVGLWILYVSKNVLLIVLIVTLAAVFLIRLILCLKRIKLYNHKVLINRVIGSKTFDAEKLRIETLLNMGPIAPIVRFTDDAHSMIVVVVPSIMRPTLEEVKSFVGPRHHPSPGDESKKAGPHHS